jgi:predicted RNase H-like HicB family nuclease
MRRRAKPNSRLKTYRLQVVVEVDEDGKYVAWCPALQGCYSQGDSYEQALENVYDVIALCLDEVREEKREVDLRYPEVVGIKQVEIQA